MDLVPLEILHQIASCDMQSYRALLTVPVFARSVSCTHTQYKCYEKTIDYMIRFGYHVRIDASGILWCLNNELHRADGPAMDTLRGNKFWYRYGVKHRNSSKNGMDDPAITWSNGNREWWYHGRRHRIGAPAIIYIYGHKEWWYHGRRHRIGAPAIIDTDGHKEWYLNGELHSQNDKPAVEHASGDKEWYCHGRRHRAGNKPAMEFADGAKVYYCHGKEYVPDTWNWQDDDN
jgi:hypothetical protein